MAFDDFFNTQIGNFSLIHHRNLGQLTAALSYSGVEVPHLNNGKTVKWKFTATTDKRYGENSWITYSDEIKLVYG